MHNRGIKEIAARRIINSIAENAVSPACAEYGFIHSDRVSCRDDQKGILYVLRGKHATAPLDLALSSQVANLWNRPRTNDYDARAMRQQSGDFVGADLPRTHDEALAPLQPNHHWKEIAFAAHGIRLRLSW